MNEYYKREHWKFQSQQDLPFLPTPLSVIKEIFNTLEDHKLMDNKNHLVDLGAGDGRVICHVAEKYDIKATGLEINTNLIIDAIKAIQSRNLQKKCTVIEADLYAYDLTQMDIVYCFVFPSMLRSFDHVIKNLNSGTIVISVKWELVIFSKYLQKIIEITPDPQFPIYVYNRK